MKSPILYLTPFLVLFFKSSDGDINISYNHKMGPESSNNDTGVGNFWQITDIHWDLEYSEFGDKKDMCHDEPSENHQNESIGHYGNYFCDSPYPLIHSALQAMKKLEQMPNFIIWTGDNAPHTNHVNFSIIFQTLKNLTQEMKNIFGSQIPLIPVLGNHDTAPKDDYPPSGEGFYGRYLSEGGWEEILPQAAQKDFKRGGYFRFLMPDSPDVLVLNTNLYYRGNELGEDLQDPGGQFNWMSRQLRASRAARSKVIIAAHAPPGYWERNAKVPFFNESYNDAFVDLLNSFGDVVLAQIYGHEHTDSFRLFKDDKGKLRSVGFLAPSLTPWLPIRLPGGTAINPSIRLYSYSDSVVLDYVQYHLNLTEANRNGTSWDACLPSSGLDKVADCEVWSPRWKFYYRATEVFKVSNLSVEAMATVYDRLVAFDDFFQQYYLINSAGVPHGYCADACKRNHFCAIAHLKIQSDVSRCSVDGRPPEAEKPFSHTGVALVAIAVSLTLIMTAMLSLIFLRRRKMERRLKDSKAGWGFRHSNYRPLRNVDLD